MAFRSPRQHPRNRKGKSQVPGRSRRLRSRLIFETLEERCLLSGVSWINPAGGAWEVADNWRDDQGVHRLPTATDDVQIYQPGSIVITHSTGDDTIHSLTSNQSLTISGILPARLRLARNRDPGSTPGTREIADLSAESRPVCGHRHVATSRVGQAFQPDVFRPLLLLSSYFVSGWKA